MFSAMFSTIAWAAVISLIAIVAAFLADGRGKRLFDTLTGRGPGALSLDDLDAAAREGSDWRLVAPLEDTPSRVSFEHSAR